MRAGYILAGESKNSVSSFRSPWSAYPVASGLGDIFSDLLGRKTQGTDLGSESGRGTDLTTGGPEVAEVNRISPWFVERFSWLSKSYPARGFEVRLGVPFTYITLISLGSNLGAVVTRFFVSEIDVKNQRRD